MEGFRIGKNEGGFWVAFYFGLLASMGMGYVVLLDVFLWLKGVEP